MGDYADMAIDQSFNDYLDFSTHSGIYDESRDENLINNWDGTEFFEMRGSLVTKSCYEVCNIIRETEKSRLIEVSDGTKYWMSKKHSILKDKYIFIPIWYKKMLIPIK